MSTTLGDLTWPEAAGMAPRILAVPIGATEQHGPHLPLSTDTDIAVTLADRLADRRSDIAVAPELAYGSSGEHAGFAGTLSIGQDAVELLLLELGRSAAATFPRMLLICAHGGNARPVRRAERRLRSEGRDARAFFPSWALDAHAGRAETSLMLALAPSRVRLDRAVPGPSAPLAEILPDLMESGVAAVSESGVLGDPAGASAEEGQSLLERVVRELCALVDEWETA